MHDIKSKSIYAVKWNSISIGLRIILKLCFLVVLARILAPSDFGLMAMIYVITDLSNIFINSGFGSALIQRKSLNQADFSSVFYLNILMGLLFTSVVWIGSFGLANFYAEPLLKELTQTISIIYLLGSFVVVQQAIFSRNLSFRELAIIDISSIVIGSVAGISFALNGFGVWSLVWSTIISHSIKVIMTWSLSPWYPKLRFSIKSIKRLWSFSNKILFNTILTHFSNKLDIIIVGRLFPVELLGLYSRGKSNADLPVNFIANVCTKSFFPILSKLQDNKEQFKDLYLKVISMLVYVSLPLFIILIINSKNLILLVFGQKWLGMVPYFQIFCVVGTVYLHNLIKLYSIKSIGRPDLNLRISFFTLPSKLFILLIVTLMYTPFGAKIYIIIHLLFTIINYILYSTCLNHLIGSSFREEFQCFYKEVFVSLFCGLLCFIVKLLSSMNLIEDLCVNIGLFMLTFISFSILFKINASKTLFLHLKSTIKMHPSLVK